LGVEVHFVDRAPGGDDVQLHGMARRGRCWFDVTVRLIFINEASEALP
jgi:hypothetical protein